MISAQARSAFVAMENRCPPRIKWGRLFPDHALAAISVLDVDPRLVARRNLTLRAALAQSRDGARPIVGSWRL